MKRAEPTRRSKSIPVYCHILKCIHDLKGDALVPNIAEKNNRATHTAGILLRQMADLGAIRVAGEKRVKGHRIGLVFAVDGLPDEPIKTKSLDIVAGAAKRARVELLVFCSVIKMLHAGNVSRQELESHSGYSRHSITRLIDLLRGYGLVYACGYRKGVNGGQVELLRFGPGKDVKRPPRVTVAESRAAYDIKRRAAYKAAKELSKNPFAAGIDDEVCARRLVNAGKVHSIAGIVNSPRSIFDLAAA